MQAQALRRLAARRSRHGMASVTTVRGNSFIKQVMDQVKRDMEADPSRKKDWEKAQQSTQRWSERANKGGEKLESVAESLKSASAKTSEMLSSWKESTKTSQVEAQRRWNEAADQNESLRKARDAMHKSSEHVSASSQAVFTKTKDIFASVMDSSSKAFSYFGDEHKKAGRLKEWKTHRDELSAAQKAAEDAKEAAEEAAQETGAAQDRATASTDATLGQAASDVAAGEGGALVVSEERSSSWDRFGASLRDMPFLSNMFENPLFDRVFGESEIAASIREMKDIDYSFQLEEFAEDIEYVVAPHIIKTYLEGDQDALKNHCGEAAFAAVNAGIKARKQQKLTLDTNILAGPKEIVLAGAKLNDKGPPCFIWTFHMQQVNCLRDKTGEIIEGAVDDIRTVCYAMVVQRHPQLDELSLEYPWQISELAILWNQPCL